MPRVRAALTFLAVVFLVYAASSVRHLREPDRFHVVDSPLLGTPPRVAGQGWHFVPRLLYRVSSYPTTPVKLSVALSGERAVMSREGTKVEVEAELTYSIPSDGVLALHRARGPEYEAGWLTGLLEHETTVRLASVSYEVVRDRDPELAQGVRSALGERVSKDGLRIERLRISRVAGRGAASGPMLRLEAGRPERRVVLIGVDSFDWRIIDPLIEQGKMPNMARLVARGARAHLRTVRPVLSPVVWTSIATGVRPSRHGIVDFVVNAPDTGEPLPVTSVMRRVPALWNLVSHQGIDVRVVAWWATWPAETVLGSIVTDRVAYQLFETAAGEDWKSADPARNRGKTHPPELIDEIRPLIKAPSDVNDDEVAWFLPGRRFPKTLRADQRELLNSFRTVIAAGETYHAIALRQSRAADTGLRMFYYEGPDTTSHLFMRYRPPRLDGVDPADMKLFGGMVDRYYERQDRFIGEILEAAGEDATIILASDHGFKSDNNRPPHSDPRIGKGKAAEWHTPTGVLVVAGPEVHPGIDLGAATVLDIAPTVLALFGLPAARDMDGQPLVEAFDPAFLERHPIAWIDSYGGLQRPGQDVADVAAAPSSDDAALLEKLRSLGYIGTERKTAHNNRGLMALEEGDIDGAIAEFERGLTAGGAGLGVRANLARAWLAKGDPDKARSLAEQVLATDPRSKEAELILAEVSVEQDDLDAAVEHLRRAVSIDPTFVQARTVLGKVYRRRGEEDAALKELEKVVEIAPLSPSVYNSIGNIHRKQGRLDQAIEAYDEALRGDVQYIGAYNNLGLCLQERGLLSEARALYEKALAIRPENPLLHNNLGILSSLEGDKEAARAHFERAVTTNAYWPVAQGNLATLLFEGGRFEEARRAFERLVELEPESAESRLGLALSYLMVQERGAAIAQFDEVLERDPDNIRAHIALGETLLREEELERAQTHLERAARIDGRIPRIFNTLGEVYLKRGLKDEAAGAFRKSLAIQPGQETIRRRLAEAGS